MQYIYTGQFASKHQIYGGINSLISFYHSTSLKGFIRLYRKAFSLQLSYENFVKTNLNNNTPLLIVLRL